MIGTVNIYQTSYGSHEIPDSVMKEAMSMTNTSREFIKEINDRRTNVHKFISEWADKQDKIIQKEWALEDALLQKSKTDG